MTLNYHAPARTDCEYTKGTVQKEQLKYYMRISIYLYGRQRVVGENARAVVYSLLNCNRALYVSASFLILLYTDLHVLY